MYGSKAGNLIKLSSNGVAVPKTWVIRNNYPLSILKKNNIDLYNKEEVYNFFENEFTNYIELYNEVEKFIKLNKEIKRYAIRSSQEYEDGEETSFSGLFYTELNVGNVANITNSIIKCWKESFNEGLLEYSKKNKKFKPTPCAVIIQQFIMSDKSGVIFRSNDDIIIDSNFGLAKSIVDGETGTDEWIINSKNEEIISYTSNKEKMNIPITSRVNPNINELINYKNYIGVKVKDFNNEDTVLEVELSQQLKETPSLNNEEIKLLINKCNIVSKILNIKNFDIEWTFDNGSLYILQCRPLTKLLELDNRPSHKPDNLNSDFGIGLVRGEAIGIAIKVYDDSTAINFPEGAILVTKRLAGNTLLSASKAIGCIIESKSPLSHSAIIARELGIPVIGNVKLDKIKDGERYYINGMTGEYRVTTVLEIDKEDIKNSQERIIKDKKTRENIRKMLSKFDQDIV